MFQLDRFALLKSNILLRGYFHVLLFLNPRSKLLEFFRVTPTGIPLFVCLFRFEQTQKSVKTVCRFLGKRFVLHAMNNNFFP